MLFCPQANNEQVRSQFNEVVTALGGRPLSIDEFKDKELRRQRTGVDAAAMDAAYDIWDQNQGNPIDKAPNGQESILFKSLEEHYGDRQKAIVAKANVYSKAFKNWFGDWKKFANVSEELLEQTALVFERIPELANIGTIVEYAAYLQEVFPNSQEKSIYWHGSDSDFSQGFDSAIKGKGSGSPHITGEFYLAKQAWTVLQYVSSINRTFGPDVNGFNHWNKLWWELKEIMSNGRRENNNWKDLIIGPDNVRQAIPNKKGIFNRDSGGENGKWLKERKADYGYQDKTDVEFFRDVFGIEYGKDTFNTWTQRNAKIFKSLVKSAKGIYPAIINTTNPIRESGKNTYYEPERGLLTQAKTKGNDAILGANTDNEFNSDVAVVFNAQQNIHFLGTKKDIESFKRWLEKNKSSKVVDENGEPLVVYHNSRSAYQDFTDKLNKNGRLYFSPFSYKWFSRGAQQIASFLNIKTPRYDDIEVGDFYKPNKDEDGLILDNYGTVEEYIIFNPNQVKSIDNDGILRDNTDNIHYLSEQDPTKIKRREVFTIEEVAFSNALATNLKALFPELSVDYVEAIDGNYVGEIDLKALRVLIHSTKSAMDTLPHEYAHYYIAMFRGSDLVNEGIAEFGSEEALVQAIGEQTVAQKGKARNLWKRFTDWIKNKLNKNKYGQQVLLAQLTDAFLTRKTLGQEQTNLDGVEHQADMTISQVRETLTRISSLVQFFPSPHIFIDRQTGKSLRSVSKCKELYGYDTYDDTNEDSVQREVTREAKDYGGKIHAVLEAMFQQRFNAAAFPEITKDAARNLEWIVNRLKEDYDFVAAEVVLADPDHDIAGITDLILRDKKTGEYVLADYKTKLVELDGSDKKKNGKRMWGFKYVDSTDYQVRTSRDSYDFQLSAYQQMLKKYGINISKRLIIPISYKRKGKDVTSCFVSTTFGKKTLPDRSVQAEIAASSAVDFDVRIKIFEDTSNSKLSVDFLKQMTESFTEISVKFRQQLEKQMRLFYRQGRRNQAYDIKSTMEKLADAQEVDFFMAYLTLAQDQLKRLVKQIDSRNKDFDEAIWDLDVLHKYNEIASVYDDIDSIVNFMYQFQNAFTKEQIATVEKACSEVQTAKDRIEGAYKQIGKELYLQQVMKYINNVRDQWEERARTEYKKNHPDANRAEVEKYVKRFIQDNKDKIDYETKNWIRRQMSIADNIFECSFVSAYFNSAYASRDPLVQASVAMFEEKMQPVDRKYNVYVQKAAALLNEYVAKYGGGNFANQRKLYDDMIEIHNGLCYLVQETPVEFTIAKEEYEKQLAEDSSLTAKTRREKMFAWLEQNAPIVNLALFNSDLENGVEVIVKDLPADEKKAITENLKKPLKDRNTWYYMYKKGIISNDAAEQLTQLELALDEKHRKPNKAKYPNKKYQELLKLKQSNDVKWRMYEFLLETQQEADMHVNMPSKRLNGRLPGVRKTNLERITEGQNVGTMIKNEFEESICLVEDDDFRGEYVDAQGRTVKQIPLFFNSKKVTEENQRFDLPTIFGMWYKQALEYDAKRQVRAYLEYTNFVLSNRLTESETVSWLDKLSGKADAEKTKVKAENTAKQYAGFLDIHMYGNKIQDMGETKVGDKKISHTKAFMNLFSHYSSLVMSFNGVGGINNFLNANVQVLEVAMSGAGFGRKSYKRAMKEYIFHTKGMLNDLASGRAPKDKISLLLKYFGLLDRRYVDLRASGMLRHSLSDIAHWPNAIGEHESQAVVMLASLIEREALDKNGKSLGSLLDYISFDEDGEMIVADAVDNFNEQDRIQFATALRVTLMEVAGNYDERMQSLATQQAWGRAILTLRKWLYPSIQRRFAKEYYDNLRGRRVRGFYRGGVKVTRDWLLAPVMQWLGLAETLKMKAVKWDELSDLDKQNFLSFATEMGVIGLCYLMNCLLSGAVDDDDDSPWNQFKMNAWYQGFRLQNDLMFYFNPLAFTRILQDPVPVITLLTDVWKLIQQLFDPLEEYTSGSRAGDYKLWYRTKRVSPGLRQVGRFVNIAEEMELFRMAG